jgi:hypothetical protein
MSLVKTNSGAAVTMWTSCPARHKWRATCQFQLSINQSKNNLASCTKLLTTAVIVEFHSSEIRSTASAHLHDARCMTVAMAGDIIREHQWREWCPWLPWLRHRQLPNASSCSAMRESFNVEIGNPRVPKAKSSRGLIVSLTLTWVEVRDRPHRVWIRDEERCSRQVGEFLPHRNARHITFSQVLSALWRKRCCHDWYKIFSMFFFSFPSLNCIP